MSTIVEMCVHIDCSGCESRIRKALSKLKGVDNVEIDMASQKVTVTGYVEQKKVLKTVRKTGRRAVLWPYPYHPKSNTFNQQYYHNQMMNNNHPAVHHQSSTQHPVTFTANPFAYWTASSTSYNYRKHGYDQSVMQGHYQMPASGSGVVGERAGSMFSDDNAHACSIM